jgi:hypothetical protein
MAHQNYDKPYPRPWPCGSVLLGFDRREAELLGHRVRIDVGVCEIRFLIGDRPAVLEVFTEMGRDRLWMRMLDGAGNPTPAPFDRLRLIPEQGMSTRIASSSDRLAFRQTLPVIGPDREKDKALRMTVRVAGQVRPRLKVDGAFVACVELNHGPASQIPERPAEVPFPNTDTVNGAAGVSREAWKSYWNCSGVMLADEALERIWYRNLYFLNCSTRPGSTCPGLFANWSHKNIGTAWHGDYHTNYNVQQPFWVTFSSNHVENHLTYVDLVHFLLPVSKGWARDYYKLPGAFFPHSAYPVEMQFLPYPVPTWGWEVCETAWVVQSLWWHYFYTMDRQFLRDRAFAPIKEAVLFLNAYMRRADAHGPQWKDDKFHIFPTVVPELGGLSADPKLNADCLVDLTLTKFVFKAYLKACEVLGLNDREAKLVSDVREILEHFPSYPTAEGRNGTVFVSVRGEDPNTVYNVPNSLMTVFPGEDHGLHTEGREREILVNTWKQQRNEGGNELVFLNLQGARLGLLDLERFKRQAEYCTLPNGTCADMVLQVGGRYGDDTPFGYMARMGIWFENFSLPMVINECLLQSYTGEIRLFPNWPRNRNARFKTLRAVGAFLVGAELAEGQVKWVRITSEVGGRLSVISPWEGAVRVKRPDGTTVMKDRMLRLDTRPGESIELYSDAVR